MNVSDFVASTTWIMGLAMLIISSGHIWLCRKQLMTYGNMALALGWMGLALTYFIVQFGGANAEANNRSIFRLGVIALMMADMYALYRTFKDYEPLIVAKEKNGK